MTTAPAFQVRILAFLQLGKHTATFFFLLKFSKHDNLFGNVDYAINWVKKNPYGETICSGRKDYNYDDGGFIITLNIISDPSDNPDTVASVAHELMHCYQAMLPAYRGVSDKNSKEYLKYQDVFKETKDELTYYFFHALYGTYPLEVGANISCVNNFVSEYVKEKGISSINGKRLRAILERCSNYYQYLEYYQIFSDKDRFYDSSVENILKLWSKVDGKKKTYNDFIKKTNEIVKTSEETLKKMDKNSMIAFELFGN